MFGLYTLRISEERYLKVDSFIQSSFQNKISPNRNIFRIVSHKPQCCNIEVQSVSLISYTFILISNFSYSTTAFIRGRFSLQNHGKSIHLKSTWLSSSRLRKRMSSIMSFMETNRRGIFFLWQKNNAFCSSAYAMDCSSLLVESFLLSKKDNWTFNELCCWRYSVSCCCASGELASPIQYYITILLHIGYLFRLHAPFFQRHPCIFFQQMLLRDLSGFLNGVECISEYKLSPFLLYGFLFQEKRIQAYLVFLKDMFGKGHPGKGFKKRSLNLAEA